NLLGNAIKFTPPGGVIELSAGRVDGGWRLTVRDTGAGIPPEQRPLLFERFWQAPEARHKGTGLGLAIAKALVEAQNGGISVESELGLGSTFVFTLPGSS
ncbi:MAG TPA: ATP-binding protein, partial [Polyangiaceae bacterium]|nr:ATP-binding protein [Polyangiaceae bacterium]